ncbi:TIGR02677 family protein [Brevibacillus massiliensis]|uniref:TIGR02677 family protein n=1 Tax=Brevibacillus massiliensis TaxID=1118054 RepID=UPI00031C7F7E|nr:TIGR02677 family protein [Brevibacillus massiliensis]
MNDRLSANMLRGVPEFRYLNAENVARYRVIMRFFYQEYQRLRYWLRPEEVYNGVVQWGVLEGYTMEQCQADLEQLKDWRNLASRHDGGRALTVEEYMRKKSQYVLTPYSIEIERMLETLETIKGYGGSLETTYLDTIAECLIAVRANAGQFQPGEALACWEKLYQCFKTMHENAADFIASMHSIQAEQMMATDAFLLMKDKLTEYLQHFIKGLQKSAYQIEGHLLKISDTLADMFLDQVAEDELRKPRLEESFTREELISSLKQGWNNLRRWFLGAGHEPSELVLLERATKETIAKVVRCALRLQERKRAGISRKKELEYLAQWFDRLGSLDEAHRLAAYAFGLFSSRHLQGEDERTTDLADKSMWEEVPNIRPIRSRSRKRISRSETEPVRQSGNRQREYRAAVEQQFQEERAFLGQLAERRQVRISDFGVVDAKTRMRLLQWIGRCMANSSRSFVTAEGVKVSLRLERSGEMTTLYCEDGELDMPDYTLLFASPLKGETKHG